MSATIDAARVSRYLGDCPVVTSRAASFRSTFHTGRRRWTRRLRFGRRSERSRPLLPARGGRNTESRGPSGAALGRRDGILPLHGGLVPTIRMRRCSRPDGDPNHSGHKPGRNDSDRAGCDVRDRHRPPQGGAVRRRPRHRQPGDRARVAGLGGPAGRPRRPRACRTGGATVGCARSSAPASRARDCPRRSRSDGPRRLGVGRRSADARLVRSAACRTRSMRRSICSSDWAHDIDIDAAGRLTDRAVRCTACRSIRGSAACSSPEMPRCHRKGLRAAVGTSRARPGRATATSCDLLSALDGHGGCHRAHERGRGRDSTRRIVRGAGSRERRRPFGRGISPRGARGLPGSRGAAPGARQRSVPVSNGGGARLGRESGVINAEFIVAVEVAGAATGSAEATIRIATAIEPEWIADLGLETRVSHEFDASRGAVTSDACSSTAPCTCPSTSSRPIRSRPGQSSRRHTAIAAPLKPTVICFSALSLRA